LSNELNGKVAIITGAAHPKGMGFAAAKLMAQQGAHAVLVDLPNHEQALLSAVKMIESEGGNCSSICVDVTKRASINSCVDNVLSEKGQIDILFNNAGVGCSTEKFLELTDKDWDMSYAVNLKGVADFCQAVIPSMLKNKEGVIVNNASLAGLGAIDLLPACYTATKHAVIGLTKAIANEFGEQNIRCNAVCPGSIKTQMMDNVLRRISEEMNVSLEEAEKIEASTIAMKRSAEPDEVASVVAFLASDGGKYITGTAIPVAGGMHPGL